MRYYFNLIPLLLLYFIGGDSVYDITIQARSGDTKSLSAFAGKRILVTDFDAAQPDAQQLLFVDSLQQEDTNLVVIAVAATDFGTALTTDALNTIYDSLGLHIIITAPTAVSKAAAGAQQPLFKWLTDVNENTHFDVDADAPGKIFVLSAAGTLYSVMEAGSSPDVLASVLTQNVDQ